MRPRGSCFQTGCHLQPIFLFSFMPPRRKKKTTPAEVGAEALRAAPAGRREQPRFRMVSYADGSQRAVRCERRTAGERAQAMADWLGAAPPLSASAHVRSMDSLLSEVLEGLQLQQDEVAPELLAAAWLRAAGDFLANQAELLSVAGGRATIRTNHPAVRFELNRRKNHIILVLNEQLGEGSVKTVRIVHG